MKLTSMPAAVSKLICSHNFAAEKKKLLTITCLLCAVLNSVAAERMTTVSIVGEAFHINGKPTYAGREWRGHRVEGLLMNSRMVQGIFDDRNPATAARWAYPDTRKWDTGRNTREFIAAMPENNFTAAVSERASWGCFDFRMKGESHDDGYQSVPVNRGLSSDRKRAFFKLLGEITGAASSR